jgi:hypothetical protein
MKSQKLMKTKKWKWWRSKCCATIVERIPAYGNSTNVRFLSTQTRTYPCTSLGCQGSGEAIVQ